MRILYFDLIGGVSGDMVVASLLDMGEGVRYLRSELKKLNISPYTLKFFRQKESHIKMGRFVVNVNGAVKQGKIYQLKDIEKKILDSQLSPGIKKNVLSIYGALYRAEKKVHRSRSSHFHQIGEID